MVEARNHDIPMASKLLKKIAFKLNYVEEKYKKYYSEDRVKSVFQEYIMDVDCGFFLCKDKKNHRIKGLLLCFKYQPIIAFYEFKRAQDLLIQPDPDLTTKEKSKVFLLLLEQYEKWAKQKDVKEIFLGINVRNDITKAMKHKGYKMADFLMKKEI